MCWIKEENVAGRLLCDQNVDSITLCYYMAPFNLTILATSSALTEGLLPFRSLFRSDSGSDSSFAEQFYLWIWLLVSGFLACSFNILSYMTIKHLSPVGTNVIANAKTPAIILMSTLFFGNPVRSLQWLGLLVTFFGILLHSQKGRVLEVRNKKKSLVFWGFADQFSSCFVTRCCFRLVRPHLEMSRWRKLQTNTERVEPATAKNIAPAGFGEHWLKLVYWRQKWWISAVKLFTWIITRPRPQSVQLPENWGYHLNFNVTTISEVRMLHRKL